MQGYYRTVVGIAVGISVLVAAGLLLWLHGTLGSDTNIAEREPTTLFSAASSSDSQTGAATQAAPSGNRFVSERYGFSIAVPSGYNIQQYEEAENARTLVFSSESAEPAFQVYISPVDAASQLQVSPELLRNRFPQLPIAQPQEVTIGKTPALAFLSRTPQLGRTREVWLYRNGYLFQVTARKQHDRWLSSIMSTWRFSAQ
jgi:hypothetical protein